MTSKDRQLMLWTICLGCLSRLVWIVYRRRKGTLSKRQADLEAIPQVMPLDAPGDDQITPRKTMPHTRLSRFKEYVLILSLAAGIGIVSIVLVYTRSDSDSSNVDKVITALVGVNGVILGLTYYTMDKVRRLAQEGLAGAIFANSALLTICVALAGIWFGSWYLISADQIFLTISVFCLIFAPSMLVLVAVQEQIAVNPLSKQT